MNPAGVAGPACGVPRGISAAAVNAWHMSRGTRRGRQCRWRCCCNHRRAMLRQERRGKRHGGLRPGPSRGRKKLRPRCAHRSGPGAPNGQKAESSEALAGSLLRLVVGAAVSAGGPDAVGAGAGLRLDRSPAEPDANTLTSTSAQEGSAATLERAHALAPDVLDRPPQIQRHVPRVHPPTAQTSDLRPWRRIRSSVAAKGATGDQQGSTRDATRAAHGCATKAALGQLGEQQNGQPTGDLTARQRKAR
jgi:hypothetical protein